MRKSKRVPAPAPKSVETITAKLHDTVAELERHAEEQLQQADRKLVLATAYSAQSDEHKAEHELATTVAGNIKSLLGV
ncbi:hypothetical protein A5747_13570 [Mycobacterium sp. IS-836]|uniref:hypothetical protein n=1 Tax=Mycobacterium sp. IS-836 TaxID=1834160 RepID=UPI00096D0E8E|nr:hypothetical protein [Mycobacterium sp. IS-836]OMC55415.1 hypothetical protein A5747_13570 [Mycobacterium sp. IS-836]